MTVVGDDGLARPAWAASDPLMQAYYDTEWGMPVRDERGMFERISLEAFQSGLSWSTILRKRPAFRAAFADFDPDVVAAFDDRDVERLMADAGIVRNLRKVQATITNARATVALREDGGLVDLVWSFRPAETPAPSSYDRGADAVRGVAGPVQGPQEARLRVRRADHDVRPDGGRRDRRHPPAGQPPPGLVRASGARPEPADKSGPNPTEPSRILALMHELTVPARPGCGRTPSWRTPRATPRTAAAAELVALEAEAEARAGPTSRSWLRPARLIHALVPRGAGRRRPG